jgi:hypothetical protein
MPVTTPPALSAIPAFPALSERAAGTYNANAYACLNHWATTGGPQLAALANNVADNATDAAGSASSAATARTAAEQAQAAAESASAASKWVSGTTYAEGFVAWSPADFGSYRRKSTGAGTTDPSADSANWAKLGAASGLVLLSTYDAASASTVDIETGIGSTYDDYLIVFENVVTSSASQLEMRFKKSGAYITGSTYKQQYRTDTGSGTWYANTKFGPTGLGTAGTSVVSGRTHIAAANTAGKTTVETFWGYVDSSAGGFVQAFGFETTSAALQGVRFYVSSGTFTSGTFRLYGFAK